MRAPVIPAALLVSLAACSASRTTDPRVVTDWMRLVAGAARAEQLSPPVAARVFAYASAAIYSGLSATTGDLPPLTGRVNEFPKLPSAGNDREDPTIVAVSAERTTLDSLLHDALPTTRGALTRLADSLIAARNASASVQTRSEDFGRRIGLAIVAWSHGDGFDSTRGRAYTAPVGPGLWVNDAPVNWYSVQNLSGVSQGVTFDNPNNKPSGATSGDRSLILTRPKASKTLPAVNMAGVTEPYWGYLRPFTLPRWDACVAGPPLAFDTTAGTPLYDEAKQVADVHAHLTPEQREIALFWADNPTETSTPAGHWMSIAAQLVAERHLSADDAAKVMLATSFATADAFITVWRYKFKHNLTRPRPFIRRYIDPNWEPLIPSPPFPEYMAGHSALSAAAATSLIAVVGNVPFEDSTHVAIGHPVRKFASIRSAGDEAGMSRIYGGIHFPSGVAVGRTVGNCVGDHVVDRLALKASSAKP